MGKKTAITFLVNKEDKFLFYLRDNKRTIPYPGRWSLLGGGVEGNETCLEALKREIKEEINYDLNPPIVFLDCFEDLISDAMVYVYKSKIDKKLDELTLTEGQKLGYFDFEEAMGLRLPGILRDFLIKNRERLYN